MDIDVLSLLRAWGGVVGLCFDILGAILVFLGVNITRQQAVSLERHALEQTIDDIGAPGLLEKNEAFSRSRALERLRGARWAMAGLCCFIVGFVLQAFSAWPSPP